MPELGARARLITRSLELDGLGLEVGPGYNPILPKRAGFRVETIDYADAEHLREKYRDADVDIGRIEPIDYVSRGRSLLETIGERHRYDYIVASHVIEHAPDLLGFLKDCEALLKPEGILSLAVPDKRYCFDIFQPSASTGEIIQAHLDGRRRPSYGSIFDSFAYDAARGGRIGWTPSDSGELAFVHHLASARAIADDALECGRYVDVHVWRFVPSSLRLILHDLRESSFLSLKERDFIDAGGELLMTLSQTGVGCPVDRLTLARQVLIEQAGTAQTDAP